MEQAGDEAVLLSLFWCLKETQAPLNVFVALELWNVGGDWGVV